MKKIINQIEFSLMMHPRYLHSRGVMKMALKLNEQYNLKVEEDKIILASLLHDVTKNYSNEENLEILNKYYENNVDNDLLLSPAIWHAITGMVIANEKYHIIEEDILNAIKFHTTGRPKMSNLEKLIFLSDFIEEGRQGKHYEEVRELAKKNLEVAIVKMYENEFNYIQKTNQHIFPLSLKAYEYYKKEVNK